MDKNMTRTKTLSACKVCGKAFDGLSMGYCSKKCSEFDNLPKKLEKAWQNVKKYTLQSN